MMTRHVVATALLTATFPAIVAPQQETVKESTLVIEYFNIPTTLEQATVRARAIVRARVMDMQFRMQQHPELSLPDVDTVYTLDVLEQLKQDPQLPVPTEVLRPGGDLATDGGVRRVTEADFPPFQPEAEYLLFLFWNENLGTYQVSAGPAGAFQITPHFRLHGFGPGALAQRYTGQDPREVMGRLREIVAWKRNN